MRARNMPEIGTARICVLAVSVGSNYFEGEKLEAIAQWMKTRFERGEFEKLYVNVCDTANRYNFSYMGVNDNTSHLVAKIKGNRWVKRNKKIFQNLGVPVEFMRWDQWIEGDETKYIHAQLKQLMYTNKSFEDAVLHDVEEYLQRQIVKGIVISTPQEALKNAIDCVLEKIAVNTCMGRRFKHIKLYPGREPLSSKLLRSSEVNGPHGLNRQYYVRMTER